MAIDQRDHRLDLLDKDVDRLKADYEAVRKAVARLREEVDSLNQRTIIRRAISPLERQLLDREIDAALARSVWDHYRDQSSRGRRSRFSWLVAVLAGIAAVGEFVSRLVGGPKLP